MKKILPYIFILIAFTGIYTINSTASAEDPKGTCTVRIMQTGEVKDWYDVTAQYCTDNTQPKNNTSLYERMNWEANRTCVAPLSLSQNNECVCQLPYGELRNGICVAPGTPQPSGSCTIQSAKFTPSGTQATSWYKDANPRKSVKIDVVGSAGCLDKEVEISIVEQDTLTPNDDIAQLDNRPIRFTNGTSFSINLNAGETGCELEGNPDCNYFIQIYKLSTPDFKSDGKSGGNLRYDCDGVCDENWLVGEIIKGPAPTPPTTETTSTTYTFLAPLPCERGTEGCNEEGELETFDPATSANAFGRYINLMIKLFIGICAVLAVVMIVMGGIEYMGSELISGKEAGKDRINGAVLGLLLALGAYTLLYTINPDLLDVSLSGVVDVNVEVELAEDNIQATATNPACVVADMVSTTLFGKSVTVNKSVVGVIQSINTAWLAMPPATRYQVNSVGGYNCRAVTNKPGFWSAHAFGLAVDINPSTNPYGRTLVTDMPPEFRNLFTSRGWKWGGGWINIKDAMHFSSTGQ